VTGSLSSDGRLVYAVEDLPVAAFPRDYYALAGRQGDGLRLAYAEGLTDAVYRSRLLALDAKTGLAVWERGGRGDLPGAGLDALLNNAYFLGPPLPLDGKLYVAVQRDFDLRLLCLDPATGSVVWAQRLAEFKSRLVLDGGRRLHAVRLTHADGLLVCRRTPAAPSPST